MLTKLMQQKDGGWANAEMADKGARGVGKMLILAEEKGRGVWTPLIFC